MLKKYKNGFLEIIQRNKFDPKVFEVTEDDTAAFKPFVLQVKDTPFRFVTRSSDRDFHVFDCAYTEFAPRFPLSSYMPTGWGGIEFVYTKFEQWLNSDLKEYFNEQVTPDLWEQISSQESLIPLPLPSDQDFTNYSEEEKSQLRLALSEFRLLIAETFKPTQEQLKTIDARLNYASDALDRLNRFDWKSILISTTLAISIALSLDTARGRLLFELLKRILSNTVYLLQ